MENIKIVIDDHVSKLSEDTTSTLPKDTTSTLSEDTTSTLPEDTTSTLPEDTTSTLPTKEGCGEPGFPTMCLNMIVKNEAHIIEKTLTNILEYLPIDYWVISDTGSTDDTKKIIQEFFDKRNIPGELVEHEWTDFAYNRNKALECSKGKSEYLFIFDADDEIRGDLVMPKNLTNFDQYSFYFQKNHSYTRPLLVNNRKGWKWTGVLHEYMGSTETTGQIRSCTLEGDYHFISGRSGNRSKNPNKYLDDAIVLSKGFDTEKTRDPGLAARYAFYCAQSYKDQGQEYHEQSIEWYKKCLELQNWSQEKYVACLYIGDMYKNKGDSDSALKYWFKSAEYDGERIECITRAMSLLRETGQNLFVNALYHKYKNYKHVLYGKLFLQAWSYESYDIEYNNSVSAFYINDKQSGYECCKKILENYKKINIVNLGLTMKNLGFYSDHMKTDTAILDLFYLIDNIISTECLSQDTYNTWNTIFEIVRPKLTEPISFSHTNGETETEIKVFLSFTTCKRIDLFQQTVNSLLAHCSDISLVDYWYCVDDNSSEDDRAKMKELYPWITFYDKTIGEKGHRASMNLIYDKLIELKPTYWVHLEDDFLFHHKMPYISEGIRGLTELSNLGVRQVVFNRNYGETINNYSVKGHIKSPFPDYVLHVHDTSTRFPYLNCHYWPHYSFRPSIIDVSTILQLGNFDSSNQFFEMDYAKKWTEAGHKTAFLDRITHRHIGRLTSEQGDTSKPNAYKMNEEKQFDNNTTNVTDNTTLPIIQVKSSCPIKIVNLERRQDRKQKTIEILAKSGFREEDYEFIKAVDGKSIRPTKELANLFDGNDFGSKGGVIGCALSHVSLWQRLVEDPDNSYYLIMEDDFIVCQDFKTKMTSLTPYFREKDVVFLGYHMFEKERNKVRSVYENNKKSLIRVYPLNNRLYIGGYYAYSINKTGAKKVLHYIAKNGIKHGIDYLNKIMPELHSYECQPQLVFSEWNEGGKAIETDIQNSNDCLDFSKIDSVNIDDFSKRLSDNYVFYPNLDHIGDDLYYHKKTLKEMVNIADNDDNCAAFNTLGFFKNRVDTKNLVSSRYFKPGDGIYVKKEYTTKNVCFIHSCYKKEIGPILLENTISVIMKSGLINDLNELYICNIGEELNVELFSHPKIKVIQLTTDTELFELPTLIYIWKFCQEQHNENTNILYLHTKGLLYIHDPVRFKYNQDWTNMMLYFLVKRYQTCLKIMKTNDCIGCNYNECHAKHFSGNFWWSKSSYIKNLKPLTLDLQRHQAEFWLLSGKDVKYHVLHNSNVNHYQEPYPESKYQTTHVKMLCNWTTSENLCKEWSNMCEDVENRRWKNIKLTWTDDKSQIDYYVIINKPLNDNEYYDPKRTVVFQMEPWVNDPKNTWGVKTWGKWAEPDPKEFLAVRGRKTAHHNNAFWQLEQSLSELLEPIPEKTKTIASICSSKYFDEGHIARIDFLKYVESKNDVIIDVYNQDNKHGFKHFQGPLNPYLDKSKGIMPYKYYFMVENNYERDFITEKIWEPILCETLVFYYGCPNVTDYIDERAFVQLDMNDFEKSYQIIKQAIEEDWHSQRLPHIREEKAKILNELAFFPTLEKIFNTKKMNI